MQLLLVRSDINLRRYINEGDRGLFVIKQCVSLSIYIGSAKERLGGSHGSKGNLVSNAALVKISVLHFGAIQYMQNKALLKMI